jgi:regulator of RNase E activity RraA
MGVRPGLPPVPDGSARDNPRRGKTVADGGYYSDNQTQGRADTLPGPRERNVNIKAGFRTSAFILALACVPVSALRAQPGAFSKEDLLRYTPEWKGERFPDGRPKVPDGILKRMRAVTLEEAWAVLRNANFNYQYEDGWMTIHPDKVLVGRALTAVWMPGRPDVQKVIEEVGKQDRRIGGTNAWAVDMLQPGDVYVVDHYGNKLDGPSIGDNVGSSIYAKSGNGIVYDGAVRDIQGLKELENFTSFIRSYHPSHHFGMLGSPKFNTTLMGINCPVRIGQATVMPGDVVLGREGAVIFIPPQFAEKVVKSSEFVRLQDLFGHQRLREGRYTAGQIDARWSDVIEKDFSAWLEQNIDKLPVGKEQIQEILKERTR